MHDLLCNLTCYFLSQGYIKDDYWAEAIFHIPMLAQLSQPGAAFDADTMWAYVPTLMHTIVIGQLNGWYRSVSESLTEWENHRTRQEHENAIIIKRFLFEAFDCYVALFYLAFFQLDVVRLREVMPPGLPICVALCLPRCRPPYARGTSRGMLVLPGGVGGAWGWIANRGSLSSYAIEYSSWSRCPVCATGSRGPPLRSDGPLAFSGTAESGAGTCTSQQAT